MGEVVSFNRSNPVSQIPSKEVVSFNRSNPVSQIPPKEVVSFNRSNPVSQKVKSSARGRRFQMTRSLILAAMLVMLNVVSTNGSLIDEPEHGESDETLSTRRRLNPFKKARKWLKEIKRKRWKDVLDNVLAKVKVKKPETKKPKKVRGTKKIPGPVFQHLQVEFHEYAEKNEIVEPTLQFYAKSRLFGRSLCYSVADLLELCPDALQQDMKKAVTAMLAKQLVRGHLYSLNLACLTELRNTMNAYSKVPWLRKVQIQGFESGKEKIMSLSDWNTVLDNLVLGKECSSHTWLSSSNKKRTA